MTKVRKNNVIIEDNKVIKKRNDRVIDLYNYLDTVGYDNYPKVIETNEEEQISEFIDNKNYHELNNGVEFIKTVSLLHYKTLRYKTVSKNKYKKIYNSILSNIEYLKEYYDNLIKEIEEEVFMSPSHYLFARNYSVIISSLEYSKSTLKKWFKLVSNKTRERVSIIHNNLSLDHFIKGDKNYLISYDNYLEDTFILDLYKFYKKEGYKLDFAYLLNEYNNNLSLLEDEKDLLYLLIAIPPKIEFINNEYGNCINIKSNFNYIYRTISVINENK